MRCPECRAECSREEADVGVGIIYSNWSCSECGWDESNNFTMTEEDWEKWLSVDEGTLLGQVPYE